MTEERLKETAASFRESAVKVEDGINKVLEPEVKDTRLSSEDTRRMMEVLARRVTILFVLSLLMNGMTLLYLVMFQ